MRASVMLVLCTASVLLCFQNGSGAAEFIFSFASRPLVLAATASYLHESECADAAAQCIDGRHLRKCESEGVLGNNQEQK